MGFLGCFEIIQNQWSFCSIFGMGFVKISLNLHALHHICIIKIFSCIIYVCYIRCNAVLSPWWIYICMSHVHAFSCIRTFNSIYFDIFVAWYFFDCLRLFLSLAPSYVSCVMAPKRKSIPSQKPLHSGASSSSSPSDPTPFHVQSHDEKAKSNFLENFSWHSIHSKCQVVLSNFSDTNLPTVIYSRGWKSLCGVLVTCPSVTV